MLNEAEALERILAKVSSLPSRMLPVSRSIGTFSARAYAARIALPVFDNSAMDGYAIAAGDGRARTRLRVSGEQPAGKDRGLRVSSGQAVRIFTGAPIPQGADAVVMQEDV